MMAELKKSGRALVEAYRLERALKRRATPSDSKPGATAGMGRRRADKRDADRTDLDTSALVDAETCAPGGPGHAGLIAAQGVVPGEGGSDAMGGAELEDSLTGSVAQGCELDKEPQPGEDPGAAGPSAAGNSVAAEPADGPEDGSGMAAEVSATPTDGAAATSGANGKKNRVDQGAQRGVWVNDSGVGRSHFRTLLDETFGERSHHGEAGTAAASVMGGDRAGTMGEPASPSSIGLPGGASSAVSAIALGAHEHEPRCGDGSPSGEFGETGAIITECADGARQDRPDMSIGALEDDALPDEGAGAGARAGVDSGAGSGADVGSGAEHEAVRPLAAGPVDQANAIGSADRGADPIDAGMRNTVEADAALAPIVPSQLAAICQIGPGITRKLDQLGIRSIADLIACDPAQLRQELGSLGAFANIEAWRKRALTHIGPNG